MGLIVLTIWTTTSSIRLLMGCLAAAAILRLYVAYGRVPFVFCHSREADDKGWKTDLIILSFTLGVAVATSVMAFYLDIWTPTWHWIFDRSVFEWISVKIPTVILQQLLFQLVVIPVLLAVSGCRWKTIFLASFVFGILHLPNPLLMLLTFLVGLFWFASVTNRTHLVSITVSHLVLAVTISHTAEDYLFDMRVGQACFQRWPQVIQADDSENSLLVYPRRLQGGLGRITQTESEIKVQGNVFDQSRGKAPKKVHLVFGDFYPMDTSGDRWFPTQILTVETANQEGAFEVSIPADQLPQQTEIRLFAGHEFGWSYPLNGSARIDLLPRDNSTETVCLFPKQIAGSVSHLRIRANRMDLIGWGFDKYQRKPLESLWILKNKTLVPMTIQRKKREQIATYHDDPRLLNCGFVARSSRSAGQDLPAIYARNPRGELERIPVELMSKPQAVVSRKKQTIR